MTQEPITTDRPEAPARHPRARSMFIDRFAPADGPPYTGPPITLVEMVTKLNLGGAQKVVLSLLEGLPREHFRLNLVTGQGAEWDHAVANLRDVAWHPLPLLDRDIRPSDDLRTFKSLRAWLERTKRDAPGPVILHTHAPKSLVLGSYAAWAAGIAHRVHTIHGYAFHSGLSVPKFHAYRLFEQVGHVANRHVVSVCEDNLRVGLGNGFFARKRAWIIRPGVDFAVHHPGVRRADRRRMLGLPQEGPIVAMVAAMKGPKNHLGFVRIARRIVDARTSGDVQFVLVGDGPMRTAVTGEIERLGLRDRFHLLGWREDLPELYPYFDLLMLPSFAEGLPLVIVEARACDVPVVASKVAGCEEIVRDGIDGFLRDPRDEAGFARAALDLLGDEGLRRRCIERGREHLPLYDVRYTVRQYARLFEAIADGRT